MELKDPDFAPALVNIRNSISSSPTATALGHRTRFLWVRRRLLGQSPLKALVGGAIMGISAAGAMIAAKPDALPKPKAKA